MSSEYTEARKELFTTLRKDFESTMIDELLPGILHNFANPLNGIMGRTQLLERKVRQRFDMSSPEGGSKAADPEQEYKIVHDVELVIQETDRFFNLFSDVAGKISRLGDETIKRISLSQLLESEMSFLNFYLDFKHQVKKNLMLDRDIPSVKGIQADYSIAFAALIRHSMNKMKDSVVKELTIATYYDAPNACVRIDDTGSHVFDDDERVLLSMLQGSEVPACPVESAGFFRALSLLKYYGAEFQIYDNGEVHSLVLMIPV